ncbi:MAG: hypothetical protein A3E79_12650 [Burkholderiales bacterium RIFCSPHIGHO2_12_FULL_61_11]|nr:MAG: hypothetical protein A3E79_12650 [Burkholderiales bacterium RIFCSPHIGHO2_12_FULL_61_11]
MCLVAFAINASARWPLVIAANRDEFLNRPTRALGRWQTIAGQEIVAGRDLRAGGTWLGMTPGGRVAFLTNVREAKSQAAPHSRGELVTRWLEETCDALAFAQALAQDGAAYGGFNLVLGDFQRNAWTWVTNKSAVSSLRVQPLKPGVYGLSNAALNTPWPKTMALKRVLANALDSPEPDQLRATLWTALANRERAPREQLPATGVPPAMEQALSSAFVAFPEHAYGTRSSTVLLASALGPREGERRWDVGVEERTHLHDPDQSIDKPSARTCNIAWQQLPALENATLE